MKRATDLSRTTRRRARTIGLRGPLSLLPEGKPASIKAMKTLQLPLDQMTAREKLRAIETIWENLARDERQVKSPGWHFDVLREREQRRKAGKEKVLDWESAKKDLRRRFP